MAMVVWCITDIFSSFLLRSEGLSVSLFAWKRNSSMKKLFLVHFLCILHSLFLKKKKQKVIQKREKIMTLLMNTVRIRRH